MAYEHIFNVNGHAEAVVIMSENTSITKQEIEDAITSGNYALNVDYAIDGENGLPEDFQITYSVKEINGDEEHYVYSENGISFTLDDIIDILESAFASTEYSED